MKPVRCILLLWALGGFQRSDLRAQIRPDQATGPQPAGFILPSPDDYAPYNTVVNYTRVHLLNKPVQDTGQIAGLAIWEDHQHTVYSDGLGRVIQTVERRKQLGASDRVQPFAYDRYGREPVRFLPYAHNSQGSSPQDGRFKMDAFTQQQAFNSAQFPGEQVYYGLTETDDTSLHRAVKQMKPGAAHAGSHTGVTARVSLNTDPESVRMWQFTSPFAVPVSAGNWPAGWLHVAEEINEAGKRTRTYSDKEGKVILTRAEAAGAAAGPGHAGWLSTYYIYDEYGRLRIVLPPKVTDSVLAYPARTLTTAVLDALCYRYDYDKKSRVILKKLPGQGFTHIVYDGADRPVLVQPPNLSGSGQWLFTKFDGLGRAVLTGRFLNSSGLPKDQLAAALESGNSGGHAFLAFLQAPLPANSYTAAGTVPDAQLYTISYYDHYQYTPPYAYHDPSVQSVPGGANQVLSTRSLNVTGKLTGSLVRVMDGDAVTSRWLGKVLYYDKDGRLIQTIAGNAKGGTDTLSMRYDFTGKLLGTLSARHNPAAADPLGVPRIRVLKSYGYDGSGRLVSIHQKVNDEPYWRAVMRQSYDKTGRVQQKVLGQNAEVQHYTYRVWGALEAINKDYCLNGSGDHFFGSLLSYDYGYSSNNPVPGRPAGMRWRLKGSSSVQRSYGYQYDAAGRLETADYMQSTNGGLWNQYAENYTASDMRYDGNGNLLSMEQWGSKMGYAPFKMDALRYTYGNNGMSNQLQQIDDAVPAYYGLNEFREPSGAHTTDYAYDGNGNMTRDANKEITSISYNFLNKPVLIQFSGSRSVRFTYTAAGDLLGKEISEPGQPLKEISYLGGAVYTGPALTSLAHEEGRVRPVTLTLPDNSRKVFYEYDFFVRDHQGNVRSTVLEEEDQNWYEAEQAEAGAVTFTPIAYGGAPGGARGFTTGLRQYEVTSELQQALVEEGTFSRVSETRDLKPGSLDPNDQHTTRLNADEGTVIGPSILLRVMAGDRFSVNTSTFYEAGEAPDYPEGTTAQQLAQALFSALSGEGAYPSLNEAGLPGDFAYSSLTSSDFVTAMQELKNTHQPDEQRPRAFLNYIMMDDQLHVIEDNSGYVQALEAGSWKELSVEAFTFSHSGYVLVFLSNESRMNVLFDNLQVRHWKGRLLEEHHYYPYGLTVTSGAYSQHPGNDLLFGSKRLSRGEFSNGGGLDWYDFGARQYDAQVGRWTSADPLSEEAYGWTPYRYGFSNPVVFSDPDGRREVPRLGSANAVEKGDWYRVGGIPISKIGQPDPNEIGAKNPFAYWGFPPEYGYTTEDLISYAFNNTAIGRTDFYNAGGGDWRSVYLGQNVLPDLEIVDKQPQYYAWGKAVDRMYGGRANSPLTDEFFSWAGKQGGGSDWYGPAGRANVGLAASALGLEHTPGSFRMTNGAYNGSALSPKYYASGWGGGSRARITTYNIGKIGRTLGHASAIAGVFMDGVGVFNYYDNPYSVNAVHPGKAGLNTGMSAYGIWINGPAALLYFGVDAFHPGGWSGFMQGVGDMNVDLQQHYGPDFRLIPFGPK